MLGDPKLDADHDEFARHIDALGAARGREALDALRALRAHVAEHFAVEDVELRQMKDGNAACHIDEHAAVLRSLAEVDEILEQAPEAESSDELKEALVAELMRWLPHHVEAMDAAVAHFRAKRRLGGAPVVLTRPSRSAA
ncbi:hemerythrin [Caldimonas thermodepolymerans]|uniref:Hemerythrin n=1 Tax=Caldimonas thermodepolymerans TaxID=215580 RepID=A0A2S5SZV5_9BURK|nr:hemerythrin [Caldimonas thermodepolymerans]